MKHIKASCL